MPNTYVKDSGSWKPVKRIWIKDSGVWKPLVNGYVNEGGVYKKFYPGTVTPITYSVQGIYSYSVPSGVTQLKVSYVTTSGPTYQIANVTPLSTVTVTIGGFGVGSSFGSTNAPDFSVNTTQFAGNVDQSPGLYIEQGVATSGANSYSGSGTSDVLEAGAAAAGIYYNEYSEGGHGDLSANITLQTTPISYLVNTYQVAITAFTGRGTYNLFQQPSSGNNYRYRISISDSFAGEGYYTFTATVQQVVALTITSV